MLDNVLIVVSQAEVLAPGEARLRFNNSLTELPNSTQSLTLSSRERFSSVQMFIPSLQKKKEEPGSMSGTQDGNFCRRVAQRFRVRWRQINTSEVKRLDEESETESPTLCEASPRLQVTDGQPVLCPGC